MPTSKNISDLCTRCGHSIATDHEKRGAKKPHVDTETRTGDTTPRIFPTTNLGGFCKVALCTCLDYSTEKQHLSRRYIGTSRETKHDPYITVASFDDDDIPF